MRQNWNTVGRVSIKRVGEEDVSFPVLAEACRRLGWPAIRAGDDDANHLHSSSYRWPFGSEALEIRLVDEMGLVVPVWRIRAEAENVGIRDEWENRLIAWSRRRGVYAFRRGPVPGTGRGKGSHGHWLRAMRTQNERRQNAACDDEGGGFVRGRRSAANLPTYWDDHIRCADHSWKRHRRTRWK